MTAYGGLGFFGSFFCLKLIAAQMTEFAHGVSFRGFNLLWMFLCMYCIFPC